MYCKILFSQGHKSPAATKNCKYELKSKPLLRLVIRCGLLPFCGQTNCKMHRLDQALDRDGGNAAQRCEHIYAILLCIQND